MKRMKLVVAALMIVAGMAMADETKQAAPQAHVVLTSIDTSGAGADVKLAPIDYPNGVFVRVKEMFGERPVSAGIFAGKLRAHGFKISESADKADVVLTIRSSSINFKEIDQDSDSLISGNKADAAAGIVITAVATGGLSLLSSDYSNFGNAKPVFQLMTIFVKPNAAGSEEQTTVTSGAIKADARNAKVTRAFFEIMSDEWLKAHLRNDDAAVSTQPSGVNVVTKQ